MTKSCPIVKLGDVLRRSNETIEPHLDKEYREITVRLWGKGVIERGRITGADTSGRRFVARTGQFIASRIDARNGAMGLVPSALDGALVTNDFPLFNLNTEHLEPSFLGWLCRTADFVELCLRASEGTTNRVRLKEDRFLALEIPLPPLSEQRRARRKERRIRAHRLGRVTGANPKLIECGYLNFLHIQNQVGAPHPPRTGHTRMRTSPTFTVRPGRRRRLSLLLVGRHSVEP